VAVKRGRLISTGVLDPASNATYRVQGRRGKTTYVLSGFAKLPSSNVMGFLPVLRRLDLIVQEESFSLREVGVCSGVGSKLGNYLSRGG